MAASQALAGIQDQNLSDFMTDVGASPEPPNPRTPEPEPNEPARPRARTGGRTASPPKDTRGSADLRVAILNVVVGPSPPLLFSASCAARRLAGASAFVRRLRSYLRSSTSCTNRPAKAVAQPGADPSKAAAPPQADPSGAAPINPTPPRRPRSTKRRLRCTPSCCARARRAHGRRTARTSSKSSAPLRSGPGVGLAPISCSPILLVSSCYGSDVRDWPCSLAGACSSYLLVSLRVAHLSGGGSTCARVWCGVAFFVGYFRVLFGGGYGALGTAPWECRLGNGATAPATKIFVV